MRWFHCEENEDGTTTATTSEGDVYFFPFDFEKLFVKTRTAPTDEEREIARHIVHIPPGPYDQDA